MPSQEAIVRIVCLVALIVLGVSMSQAWAHDGPNGCYPATAFQKLKSLDPYTRLYADGSMDLYVCDDVAMDAGMMGTDDYNILLTNQVWWEGWCGDASLTVWVVNCNEA